MSMPPTQTIPRPMRVLTWGRLSRRIRIWVALTVALVTLLSATAVFAQASINFDLACRSVLTGGGGTLTGGNFGVIAALGMPIVPPQDSPTAPTYSLRNSTYGVRAGFLPGYPNGQTAAVAANAPDQTTFVQHLPLLYKVVYIIRGGC